MSFSPLLDLVDSQDLCKRAAVLSNKVLKHGFVQEMESILDNETKITHEELSRKVQSSSQCPIELRF